MRTAKGMALYGCGRTDDALTEFNLVLAEQNDPVCQQYRASCLMTKHDFDSALTDINLLLEAGHCSPDILVSQFLCLKHLNQPHQALAAFEQIRELDESAFQQLSDSFATDLNEVRNKASLITVS